MNPILNNKQTIKEYNSKYYAVNKDRILKRMSESIECPECCRQITRQHMKRHLRSKLCKIRQLRQSKDNYIKNKLKKMLENDKLKESAQSLLNLIDD